MIGTCYSILLFPVSSWQSFQSSLSNRLAAVIADNLYYMYFVSDYILLIFVLMELVFIN